MSSRYLIAGSRATGKIYETYYVYILASRRNGTLYIGVTSNLIQRIWTHKNKQMKGFTSKYNIYKLVHFEEYAEVHLAIQREKRLKEWPRKWKLDSIEQTNPQWKDLYETWIPLSSSGMTLCEVDHNT